MTWFSSSERHDQAAFLKWRQKIIVESNISLTENQTYETLSDLKLLLLVTEMLITVSGGRPSFDDGSCDFAGPPLSLLVVNLGSDFHSD